MDSFVGKRLDGRYEIHEQIGEGGMACVYKAFDKQEQRWVAVKILKQEYSNNNEFLRRFRNESKAIAMLSHPNIVRIFDVSLGDRVQYIVMEYIDGITLKSYMERTGALKEAEAIHFTVQILRALQHAHAKGVIHRDIKPQNIMLLQDGTIKVTDFGIARFANGDTNTTITMVGKAIGSVHYIAPEQARGDITDEKADIYSVGVMLYEMLSGRLPFEADNAVSVAIMQLQSEPEPLREIDPGIPEGLEEITLRAMQKNITQRYQSAEDMLQDLSIFKRDPNVRFGYSYSTISSATHDMDNLDRVVNGSTMYSEQYAYDEELIRSKWHNRLLMVFAGMGTAILIAALLFLTMFIKDQMKQEVSSVSDEILLPDFVGKVYESEIKNSREHNEHFTFIITDGNNPDKAPGVVLKQSPNGGVMVKKGKEVTLIVNVSPDQTVVPDVIGYAQNDAYSRVKGEKLTPKILFIADEQTAAGYVISTQPARGTPLTVGETVNIYVSTGTSDTQEEIPPVLGDTVTTAKLKLEAAGFVVAGVQYQDDSGQEKDIVLETDPLPGNKAPKGTAVYLVASSGKMTAKKIEYFLVLPSHVNEDLEVKIYRDGFLDQTKIVNPSLTSTLELSFEGTAGTEKLVVMLDGQDYIHIDLNFDTGVPTVTAGPNPYVNPHAVSSATSSAVSSGPSSKSESATP